MRFVFFNVSSEYLKDSGRFSDEQIKESHCKRKFELQIAAPELLQMTVYLVAGSNFKPGMV
jgi:hypothetical protein